METHAVKPYLTWDLDSNVNYLLQISGEWFVGSFDSDGYLSHTCGGQNTMWDNYKLSELMRLQLLNAVYRIKE